MSGSKENKQEALQKENEYKVTWKGWVSLAFLIISFSGLVAHQDNFLKAFDLMNLMGQFGHADGAKIAMQEQADLVQGRFCLCIDNGAGYHARAGID